jgi:PAS domain S-box-containing protein
VGEQHEFRFRTRDGRLIDGLVSSNPIPGPAGEYLGTVAFVTDLTERKRSSETLARSERHYRTLVELTGTGYVVIDLQGRVLDANAEYVRLAGQQRLEELLGRSVVEWTAEYDRERNAREVAASLPRGGVSNLEVDYQHADGRIIPILINAAIIDDPERGKVIQALCRDVSSRRAAEQALRESQDRYALSVEGASAGIWDWDIATGTVF